MQNLINNEIIFEEDTLNGKYLTFFIENQSYGIEIKHVTEIISIQPITEMPDIPEYIKGIINLRGRVIPLIDVRLRFKKETAEYTSKTSIIVIDIMDKSIGLIVDYVNEVITISENDMVESTIINSDFNNRYIKGFGKIGNEIILLLDCMKLLTQDELKDVSEVLL